MVGRTSSVTPLPDVAEEQSLFTEADAELEGLARSQKAPAAASAALRCVKDTVDGPIDVASSADDISSAPSSP